ncbi:unnamed protein product [Cercospora beticola]|nr:unnamed protein product [Cercospora beticola]
MSIDLTKPVSLDKARQVKFWKRCIKTLLPHHYTGNESNRMYLGFFMLSALDLLDSLHDVTTESERDDYINWIYRCQHPEGGFRMWPGTDFGELRNEENAKWDPANLPATYFALSALLCAGDDLKRVHRAETLQWIRRIQRPGGSFGETIIDGQINGGLDPRFGYCAAGIRYILRGEHVVPLEVDGVTIDDIDIDAFVKCVRLAESYDGGIADYPYHEPHAGYEFCSLGALKFIGRLATSKEPPNTNAALTAPSDPDASIRWLIERQTDLEELEEEEEIEEDSEPEHEVDRPAEPSPKKPRTELATDSPISDLKTQLPTTSSSPISDPVHQSPDKSTLNTTGFPFEPSDAGMNGRTNKVADTCYAFWAGASFHLMSAPQLYCKSRLQRYLLEKTQNPILGGFGKFPGDLPDLYHSYLALAALALDGCEGLLDVDPAMCISKRASGRLPEIWERWGVS